MKKRPGILRILTRKQDLTFRQNLMEYLISKPDVCDAVPDAIDEEDVFCHIGIQPAGGDDPI